MDERKREEREREREKNRRERETEERERLKFNDLATNSFSLNCGWLITNSGIHLIHFQERRSKGRDGKEKRENSEWKREEKRGGRNWKCN